MPSRERAPLSVRACFKALAAEYPDAHCELDYRGEFQLLAAVILSAQCTDRAVNRATPALFAAWPDAASLARAEPAQVERRIRSLGLYRSKARNLVGMAQALVRGHGGRVPRTMEELVRLPGVGRKTANVVLSEAFGLPGLAVDTHVLRVGARLGLFRAGADPAEAEKALCSRLPPKDWGRFSHLLIWHGRRLCSARAPKCPDCPLRSRCPSALPGPARTSLPPRPRGV